MNYRKQKERAQKHAERIRKKQELKEIWHSNDKRRKPLAFSKVAFIVIFLDCLVIQFFSMWIMVYLADASNLGSLIGIAVALIGEVGACISYNRKSTIENSCGGIVYESFINSIKSADELSPEEIEEAVG